ncbi:MAG: 3-phosphoserine/phosphohydroxythreonine transaminase [Pseudomonadota bacterium]
MTKRVYNFSAGPATLPLDVLKKAKEEFLNYDNTGMSIVEASHRGKAYDVVHKDASKLVRELLKLPDNYHVLYLQGGASLQFAMVPMNLLGEGKSADYVITGDWSKKAYKEAKLFGDVKIVASSEEEKFSRIPKQEELKLNSNAKYVHITSNNTIFGTQFDKFPSAGSVPIVADMSSDMMWRFFDVKPFGLIYAGAQKNLGPAGVTLVIIRDDLLKSCNPALTTMLKYSTHAEKDSLFNTPPCFSIYILRYVMQWIKDMGGLDVMEKHNREKAGMIYSTIEESDGFYKSTVSKDSRSMMNITYRLPSEDLEKSFIEEAAKEELVGLKGHRSVGGIRASVYNAMPKEGCEKLSEFMRKFAKKHS